MVPSRRKGASKAVAAAAAARRQWKVGDLVLAKVKGFPAWPATVTEPEKWGYSADWKKVLVYFFGTQQIAFCNPADVEAFTEEKKESLLIKRHGKGADFVRAVREIIDSYEKLKKHDLINDFHSSEQVTLTNAGRSEECVASSVSKDTAYIVTVDSCSKTSDSSKRNDELGFLVKGDTATTQGNVLHDRNKSEVPSGNLVVTKTPLPSTYSRKKHGGTQAQNCIMQRTAPSAQRSRSSSRANSRRFQNFTLPPTNSGKSTGNVSANVLRDGSVVRNKRVSKSPDVSDRPDADSPFLVSNGSLEENGSEIVTVDSDTQSFNEGITVQSGYELQPQYIVECFQGDFELSKRLDNQAMTVIVKKKRKPNRKRASNSIAEFPDNLDKQACLGIEVHKTGQIFPSDSEKYNGKYSKEDGDEHLPLVKRARVRMGRTLSAGEELDTVIEMEERPSEISSSRLGQDCIALNDLEGTAGERKSFDVRVEDNSSSISKYAVSKPPLWESKKHQQFGCLADGESALPPSKRLHRALEAMSANAAEDKQISPGPSTMQTIINECISSTRDDSNFSEESKARDEFGVRKVESFSNSASQSCSSGLFNSLAPPVEREHARSVDEEAACSEPIRSTNSSPEHVLCEDVVGVADCADGKDLSVSTSGTRTAETFVVAQSTMPLSPHIARKQALPECNQGLVDSMLPSKDECKIETSKLSECCKYDPSDISMTRSDPVSINVENETGLPQNDTNLLQHCSPDKCSKLSVLPLDENNRENRMSMVVKETISPMEKLNAAPSLTAMEVLKSAVQGVEVSRSTSLSEDCLSHKTVSGTRISSSPTDGLDSTARASPPNTSICNISASDNSNSLENNGCCSPDVHLHHEKPKHAGKWSITAESNAALASFVASLGTLTRTKKNIDRATRIAIDCGKFGIATKVLEIITRSLESEPSLHRRVDLFFLVDSIAQCSRGLGGDVGGMYPSAIQALLPRLLLAAAPPGTSAQENRRQCLKVLKLWQERRILPEPMIHHHIRELHSLNSISSTISFSRRSVRTERTERSFDDPLREMEGMLVDEYGSNSSFQLPGFHMPSMLKDGDQRSDSDGGSFEAVTPEHNPEIPEERDRLPTPATEKHTHILEEVDGELEMEDVAPPSEGKINATSNVTGVNTGGTSHHEFGQHFPQPLAPPLPKDVPPSSPPLPVSPPPPPPPPPPFLPPPLAIPDAISNCHDPKLYVGAQNMNDGSQHLNVQSVHYHGPESRDIHMEMQILELANSCSFSGAPVPHPPCPPAQAVNNAHLRPPHPAPSTQFSYFQADRSRREIPPPSYPNRFHFVNSTDSGNFHSDHDRMNLPPQHDESWRFSAPFFSGPSYPDSARVSYAPNPFAVSPCEPAVSNHSWPIPPRPVSYREMIPHRPPSEGPIPVATRASNFWRPR